MQLWLLEERGDHLNGLTAHLPALNTLYSCLSPTPPRHIKEHTNYGTVSTNGCLCVCLGTLVQTIELAEPSSDSMLVYVSSVCPCPLGLPCTQSGYVVLYCHSVHSSQQAAGLMHDMCRWSCLRRPLLAWALMCEPFINGGQGSPALYVHAPPFHHYMCCTCSLPYRRRLDPPFFNLYSCHSHCTTHLLCPTVGLVLPTISNAVCCLG